MDNKDEKSNEHRISFEITEEVADGQYANICAVAHSGTEFILDFAKILPGLSKAKVKSRIIMTPVQAKRLLRTLSENIKRYEMTLGEIDDKSNNNGGGFPPFGFSNSGEA